MLNYGVVDTHVHLWNEDDVPCLLTPYFGKYCKTEDYTKACNGVKVEKYIFMECARNENDYILECESIAKMAKDDLRLKAFVAWAPLSSGGDNAAYALKSMCKKYPMIKGIRQAFFTDPDGSSYVENKFIEGVLRLPEFGLSFAIGSSFNQNVNVLKFLDKVEGRVEMVLDHLGKPPVTQNLFEDWAKDIDKFSQFPNLHLKLSSISTEAADTNWTYEEISKYVKYAARAFGWNRIIYGSDYPVLNLRSDITRQMETLIRSLKEIGATEENLYNFFVVNPCKLYKI